MTVPRLAATALTVTRAGRRVLDSVSLALAPGEIATVQGASGSGKTTLLRVLASLTSPDAGTLALDGVDAATLAPTVYRTRVAFVSQQPPMLDGTVGDNVAAGPRFRGLALTHDAVTALLARVGLGNEFAGRIARDLSGGERQRVALARALANEPRVFLLDEPTAALDPAAATHVLDLVRTIARDGPAVLVVTHAVEHARALAGTPYAFAHGRLEARA